MKASPLSRAKPAAPRMSSPVVVPINPAVPPQPVVTSQPRSAEVTGSVTGEGEAEMQARRERERGERKGRERGREICLTT